MNRLIGAQVAWAIAGLPVAAAGAAELPLPTAMGELLCFGRTYPWAEIEAAPERAVTSLTLILERGEYGVYFWLDGEFIDRPGLGFTAGGTCRYDDGEDEGDFVCPIDGDGGWFLLDPADAGGVILTPVYGLRLQSMTENNDDPDDFAYVRAGSTAGSHHLVPLPEAICN